MNNIEKNYKQAVDFISNHEYNLARELLEEITINYPHHSQINYALGLIEAATGHPHVALNRWKHVDLGVVPTVVEMQQKIAGQLPNYKVIFDSYNKAIHFVNKGNYQEAAEYFVLAFETGEEHGLPLPVHIYKSYLLGLTYVEKKAKALVIFSKAPAYIRNSPELKLFQDLTKENQHVVQRKPVGEKWAGRVSIVLALAGGIFLGGIFLPFDKAEENQSAKNESESLLKSELAEVKQSEAALQVQLEQQITLNEQNVDRVAEAEEANKEIQDLMELATVNLADIETEASYQSYLKGVTAYQSGDFDQAIHLLDRSLQLEDHTYYADDASYFQIQSVSGLDEPTSDLMISFLENKSEHYEQSPYRDDIMLQLAEFYLANDEPDQAKIQLNDIIKQYPGEWTALRAEELLEQTVVD